MDQLEKPVMFERQLYQDLLFRRLPPGLWLLASVLLSACGGGASSGNSASSSSGPDPLVEDYGIAYVRQPVPEMDTADVRDPASFTAGADLMFRELASPSATERNLTFSVTAGMGDVRDVEASFDGSKLLFALHLPEIEGADPEDQPTWNIWEYDIAANQLIRAISSDITAEAGQDVAPHYLADGRIIFSSTRQRTSKALLLDEGKPQFEALDEDEDEEAVLLHVMNSDGSDIHQVTFNQSHDMDPVVLDSGEVVFSRWDNMGSNNAIHLYKMNPDGTNLHLLYGARSHQTGSDGATVQYLQARENPNGGLFALLKPFSGAFQGSDIISIDTGNYVENNQPLAKNAGILSGPAQLSVAFNPVRTDDQASSGGRFNAFYPLWDGTNRAIISWSQCRLLLNNKIVPCTNALITDPAVTEAPPLYSVYIYDMDDLTITPMFIPQEGILYRDVVAAQPRTLPRIIFDKAGIADNGADFDASLIDEGTGILNIRSVYEFDGSFNALASGKADIESLADPAITSADERPARFIRIVKAVSIPDDDLVDLRGFHFGRSRAQLMREIIGYAPIEPDGSVRVKIPANIPFAISILDRNGKRITDRHQSWLQLRPGEILNCTGCHDSSAGVSHGRAGSFTSIYSGAIATGVPFPNTLPGLVDSGDTMAEARTRNNPTALNLSVDIHFTDDWTDSAVRPPDTFFDYLYADLNTGLDPLVDTLMTVPVAPADDPCQADSNCPCQTTWTPICRIVINYEGHIHPLWNKNRGIDTCTACHADKDNAGADIEPAGQLDLSDGASDQGNGDHFKSYRELLFGDTELILDAMGVLVERQEQVIDANGMPVFETDADGNLLLDINGQPIPVLRTFGVGPSMNVAGARASNRFFSILENPPVAPATVDHSGMLSGAELKMLAEWLDIGGQYFNNPFDTPP